MRFSDTTLTTMLTNTDPKRLIYLLRLAFPSGPIRIHSGIGEKTYNGETYLGVGSLGSISTLSEDGSTSAKRLSLGIQVDDYAAFAAAMNDNPIGYEGELFLASLDENRRISATALLFAGDIADYNLKKGKPNFISVALSDWFETWGRPAFAAKYTDASQQALHPGDEIFSQVDQLAQGIDDSISGRYIGNARIGGAGRSGGGNMMLRR
ncbi:hypothetical protein IT774_05170 [Salinimonas marina]|uniref:DUF2163 domain-containing protein n=1 Tax=Salinimonas marina TaxID=2785918 RepID=A0A7S9E038_9ALTE|nr:hypothetical protein [Salinimonas marina]QPG06565.1 hypothetical protein IT774_05170 [Salinimonas marina]